MSIYYSPTSGKDLNIDEMPLPKFAKDWLKYLQIELNRAPRTVFNYAVSANTFLRWVKYRNSKIPLDEFQSINASDVTVDVIASFQRVDIYDFLSFCATKLDNSISARSSKLSALRSLYSYLKDYSGLNIIQTDPTANISSPKKEKRLPKYLDISEAKQLLGGVEGPDKDRDYCIILWFLSCGMRLSELVGINTEDVRNKSVRIFGKGRKERVVPLNTACMDALENYLIIRTAYHVPDAEHALFVSSRTKKRLTTRRVQQIVEASLKNAGLIGLGLSTHKLRHSTASMLYSNNVGLLEIKEILGHESLKSTEVYTHLINKKATESAIESLGEALVNT